jgi:hypothetical protein
MHGRKIAVVDRYPPFSHPQGFLVASGAPSWQPVMLEAATGARWDRDCGVVRVRRLTPDVVNHALARACMERGQFDRARRCLRAAMSLGDAWLRLPQIGNDLERLWLYAEAWRALAAVGKARVIADE